MLPFILSAYGMPKLPSSKLIIKVLEQKGSHAKYRKGTATVIVPTPRKEIPIGTFRSIVRQSGLDNKVFTNHTKK